LKAGNTKEVIETAIAIMSSSRPLTRFMSNLIEQHKKDTPIMVSQDNVRIPASAGSKVHPQFLKAGNTKEAIETAMAIVSSSYPLTRFMSNLIEQHKKDTPIMVSQDNARIPASAGSKVHHESPRSLQPSRWTNSSALAAVIDSDQISDSEDVALSPPRAVFCRWGGESDTSSPSPPTRKIDPVEENYSRMIRDKKSLLNSLKKPPY
jgi:hypothetical protein